MPIPYNAESTPPYISCHYPRPRHMQPPYSTHHITEKGCFVSVADGRGWTKGLVIIMIIIKVLPIIVLSIIRSFYVTILCQWSPGKHFNQLFYWNGLPVSMMVCNYSIVIINIIKEGVWLALVITHNYTAWTSPQTLLFSLHRFTIHFINYNNNNYVCSVK